MWPKFACNRLGWVKMPSYWDLWVKQWEVKQFKRNWVQLISKKTPSKKWTMFGPKLSAQIHSFSTWWITLRWPIIADKFPSAFTLLSRTISGQHFPPNKTKFLFQVYSWAYAPSIIFFSSVTVVFSLASVKIVDFLRRITKNTSWKHGKPLSIYSVMEVHLSRVSCPRWG